MYVPDFEVVPEEEQWVVAVETGYINMHGNEMQKVIVSDPNQVARHRDEFRDAYEADVRFVQRMLIDTGLKSCFKVNTISPIILHTTIEPVSKIIPPLVLYMDIEVKTKARFPNVRNPNQPVISVTFYDSWNKKYYTIVVDERVSVSELETKGNWFTRRVKTPRMLAKLCLDYVNHISPDILTGWNINFDLGYYQAWARYTQMPQLVTDGMEVFDLLQAYKKTRPNVGNELKEVVVREGVVTRDDLVSEAFSIEMYENYQTRDDFILYNKKDVEYCVQLDTGFEHVDSGTWIQYDLIKNFWARKNFVGLADINDTLHHSMRHDPLWLRKARELNIVLPSKNKTKGASLDYGGIVLEPSPGIYKDITVLDMTRYYPSILLSFPKQTSPDIWGKIGPAVIGELSAERDFWDAELAKHTPGTEEWKATKVTQTVVKHFLSGAWGFFAYSGSRIHSKERGDFVLRIAGDGLLVTRDESSRLGHEPIYGDTDSIFIRAQMDEVDNLVDALNERLTEWAHDMGVTESRFNIKEDRFAENTLFVRGESASVGVKKRYGQWVIRENHEPCDYILIKGFDYVRGNTSAITKKLQKKILDSVLRDGTDGLLNEIREVADNIIEMKYPLDDITIPVNLSKEFTAHDYPESEYYIGAAYNNRHIGENIIPGDLVRYFKVKEVIGLPRTSWFSYIESRNVPSEPTKKIEPDLNWVLDRTLRSPNERILEAAGITWDNVMGMDDMDNWFG
jgi:DNA polymerase elongation subunit (family B)